MNIKSKGKGNIHHSTGREGSEVEYRYSSTLSLTSTIDGGGWPTPRPGLLISRKETSVLILQEAGLAPEPV